MVFDTHSVFVDLPVADPRTVTNTVSVFLPLQPKAMPGPWLNHRGQLIGHANRVLVSKSSNYM